MRPSRAKLNSTLKNCCRARSTANSVTALYCMAERTVLPEIQNAGDALPPLYVKKSAFNQKHVEKLKQMLYNI